MPRKLTTEDFIKKSHVKHGNKYDYSLADYRTTNDKVVIICPTHDKFEQRAGNHLNGMGCFLCAVSKRANKKYSSTSEFIKKSKLIHGDKYDYSKTDYKGAKSKVIIICPIHGTFKQTPTNHLSGYGCGGCSGTIKSNTNEFIKKSKLIHGDKYDYSKTDYKGAKSKVIIICPIHGKFRQTPNHHLVGNGCYKCCGYNKNTSDFIIQAKIIHKNKYSYEKTIYTNALERVTITCPLHGDFEQIASDHVNKRTGCSKCNEERKRLTIEEFIIKATEVHGDYYDYSEVKYINRNKKVKINCPIHGAFYQSPLSHIYQKHGCSKCNQGYLSRMGSEWLDTLNIPDDSEHREVCNLLENYRYRVDGYDPHTNTVYEFYGDYWHGNPAIYDPQAINPSTKCTFGELYKQTQYRRKKFQEAGYTVIEMWEKDWHTN